MVTNDFYIVMTLDYKNDIINDILGEDKQSDYLAKPSRNVHKQWNIHIGDKDSSSFNNYNFVRQMRNFVSTRHTYHQCTQFNTTLIFKK